MPSRPSISAAPRKCGTRKTRILAIDVSKTASSSAADRQLADVDDEAGERRPPACRRDGAIPQGTKMQAISET